MRKLRASMEPFCALRMYLANTKLRVILSGKLGWSNFTYLGLRNPMCARGQFWLQKSTDLEF